MFVVGCSTLHGPLLTMCLLLFVVVCCVQDVLHQVAELHCLWTEAQRDFVGRYV